jgi:hypothetical protein
MRRRKRLLLILCLVLVAVIGFVLWASRGGTPSLSDTFIGYTNRPIARADFPLTLRLDASNVLIAIVRATNTSPVSVSVWCGRPNVLPTPAGLSDYRSDYFPGTYFVDADPNGNFLTRLLKPGEATTAEVYLPAKFDSWDTQFNFSPYGFWESLRNWAGKLGGIKVGGRLAPIGPRPKVSRISLGPITNQPPIETPLNR